MVFRNTRHAGMTARRQGALGAILLGLSLSAGCSGNSDSRNEEQGPASELPPDELFDRIEAARELKPREEVQPERIGTLADAEIPQDLRIGPACTLMRGGALLLVAGAQGAAARIDGRPVRLQIAAPVGPSGGFFRAEGVTISIGRQVPPTAAGPEPAALATATIGNGADAQLQKIAGMWECRGGRSSTTAGAEARAG